MSITVAIVDLLLPGQTFIARSYPLGAPLWHLRTTSSSSRQISVMCQFQWRRSCTTVCQNSLTKSSKESFSRERSRPISDTFIRHLPLPLVDYHALPGWQGLGLGADGGQQFPPLFQGEGGEFFGLHQLVGDGAGVFDAHLGVEPPIPVQAPGEGDGEGPVGGG